MIESNNASTNGYISGIYGSLIEIKGLENNIRLHDLIKVANRNILGEVIQIYTNYVVAQCFEDVNNLKLNFQKEDYIRNF